MADEENSNFGNNQQKHNANFKHSFNRSQNPPPSGGEGNVYQQQYDTQSNNCSECCVSCFNPHSNPGKSGTYKGFL
jgi:hypothetical protein